MTTTEGTWQYGYDDNGYRTEKTAPDGITTKYYRNGTTLLAQVTADDRLDFFYDEKGQPLGFKYSVPGTGTQPVTSLYYYRMNLQGDIEGILDASGNEVCSYTYDAWGKPLGVTGSAAATIGTKNPLRYRGYFYDEETGWYYLNSRHYDPETRRMLPADTEEVLLQDNKNLSDKNLFAYCDNNPIVRTDTDGDCWYMVAGAVIGGAISGGLELISQACSGTYDISKILIATTAGAVGGAFAATSLDRTAQIVINAGIGIVSYIADSIAHEEDVTIGGIVTNGAAGALSGFIGGPGAKGKLLQNNWKVAQKTIAKETRRASYKYSEKKIAESIAIKTGIKKTIGIATGRFTAGAIASRGVSNIRKICTWWKNLWKK